MKKIFALVLAMMLVLASVAALADDEIKITLHSKATAQTKDNDTKYDYYEIFKASISGTAVAYYLDSPAQDTLKGLLANVTYVNSNDETITPFTFTKSADGVTWVVNISEEVDDNDGVALSNALNTSDIKAAAIAHSQVAANGTSDVEIVVPNAGYYLIVASNGKNLVLKTLGDVTIDEKNTYPPIYKTQADEDNTTQNTDDRKVAVGDTLTYNVKVHVPASAKVNDVIEVWDKASNGLTYNSNSMSVSPTGAAAATTLQAGDTWRQRITVTSALIDQDVVFSFTMTVNDDALVDSDKENEAGLKYGNGSDWYYESLPVEVVYKTYFAGIHKVDNDDESLDLEGVEFELKEKMGNNDPVAFNVRAITKGGTGEDKDDVLYYIPGGSSNTVITDKDGLIKIRGLDDDKVYTLTETKPLPGYNNMTSDITLVLHEDTVYKFTEATEYVEGTTYYDENGDVAEVTEDTFANGTYFTRTGTESFNGATDDTWDTYTNSKGSTLPETGGIGTTIFYIAGSILVLAAAILLITKRRMGNND